MSEIFVNLESGLTLTPEIDLSFDNVYETESSYSIKEDKWISRYAQGGMITPFCPKSVREITETSLSFPVNNKVISYGLSSYVYDIRLSPNDFRIFRHIPGTVVDPKAFNPDNLEQAGIHSNGFDSWFILPAHSYGLS